MVKICKSLPERKPVTVLTLSVDNVILIASSSNPSAALKLKKSPTFEPNKDEGKDALPPKYKRPSWKVAVKGQPLLFDQASS